MPPGMLAAGNPARRRVRARRGRRSRRRSSRPGVPEHSCRGREQHEESSGRPRVSDAGSTRRPPLGAKTRATRLQSCWLTTPSSRTPAACARRRAAGVLMRSRPRQCRRLRRSKHRPGRSAHARPDRAAATTADSMPTSALRRPVRTRLRAPPVIRWRATTRPRPPAPPVISTCDRLAGSAWRRPPGSRRNSTGRATSREPFRAPDRRLTRERIRRRGCRRRSSADGSGRRTHCSSGCSCAVTADKPHRGADSAIPPTPATGCAPRVAVKSRTPQPDVSPGYARSREGRRWQDGRLQSRRRPPGAADRRAPKGGRRRATAEWDPTGLVQSPLRCQGLSGRSPPPRHRRAHAAVPQLLRQRPTQCRQSPT